MKPDPYLAAIQLDLFACLYWMQPFWEVEIHIMETLQKHTHKYMHD